VDYESSLATNRRALSLCVERGDELVAVKVRWNIACTMRELGRLVEARRLFEEEIPVCLAAPAIDVEVVVAEDYGAVLAELGDDKRAVALLGAAEATRERNGTPRVPAHSATLAEPFAKTRAALAPDVWDEAYAAGRETTVGELLGRILGTLTG
jgi:hypothetical protein